MARARSFSSFREETMTLSPKYRAVFTTAGWNSVLRLAAIDAGQYFIATHLPKRWEPLFAINQLGADGGRDGVPFFSTGKMLVSSAMARATATAKAGMVKMQVKTPAGGLNFHPRQKRAFTKITPFELFDVARVFSDAVEQIVERAATGGVSRIGKRGGARAFRGRLSTMDQARMREITRGGARSNLAQGRAAVARRGEIYQAKRNIKAARAQAAREQIMRRERSMRATA
jgi:hypothetical protein